MVDVGDDRKIADLIHAHSGRRGTRTLSNGGSDGNDGTLLGATISRSGKWAPQEAKKKARRIDDAPSNKTYGNCLLGLHCSQNTPGASRAKA
jgi:hypothetical protein